MLGDYTDGLGGPKTPLQEYSCSIKPTAPAGAIVKISRSTYKITCPSLSVRYEPGASFEVVDSKEYATGKEVPWTGQFLELVCKENGSLKWQDIVMQVIEKPALKSVKKKKKGAMNIAVIMMDSMSRAETMHYLPKTAKLLKSLSGSLPIPSVGKHRSFVYNRAQINGPGTANNLSPLLCGKEYAGSFQDMVARGWTYFACDNFIWNYLKDHGYVSAYGAAANMFAGQPSWPKGTVEATGHLVPPYMSFDAAGVFISCSGCNSGTVPCCGSVTAGDYQFKYMENFHSDEVYPDAGKFSFIMLMSAHSNSAHMQSEDTFIHNYIQKLLEREDTVVHLGSDHGNGNEGWRVPMSSLIVPTKYLNANPEVAKNLEVNHQLTQT